MPGNTPICSRAGGDLNSVPGNKSVISKEDQAAFASRLRGVEASIRCCPPPSTTSGTREATDSDPLDLIMPEILMLMKGALEIRNGIFRLTLLLRTQRS